MRWLDGITDSMDMSPGVVDGQRGLAYCSPWGGKELDTTEQLNGTELVGQWNIIKVQKNDPFIPN